MLYKMVIDVFDGRSTTKTWKACLVHKTLAMGKVGYVFLRVTYLTLITFSFYETAPVWIRIVYFWRDYLINPSEITEHKTEVWMF